MSNDSGGPSDAVLATITGHLRRAREASGYETAQRELEAALAMLPVLEGSDRQDAELVVWMDYSLVAEHYDDFKTAVDYNERVVLRRPNDLPSHLALSKLYGELGDAEKATESLRKCGELAERLNDETVLAILATKGYLPREEGARARRLEGAVATYREVLKEFTLEAMPDRYAATQTTLGSLCRQQAELLTGTARTGKLEEAARAYREALNVRTAEAFPDKNRTLLQRLGEIEMLLGDSPQDA